MDRGDPTIKVGGTGGSQYELRVTQTLNGDIESVRGRLSSALNRLGYDVLSDKPALEARRGARGWARWGGSSGVLESSVALTVWLKADSAYVTHAIFDYKSWADPTYKRGDMEVLAREARAITAVAATHSAATSCAACGTEDKDESRFCRHCGAPKTSAREPAELELLRLMAETRAGQIPLKLAAFLLFISCLFTLAAGITAIATGAGAFRTLLSMMFVGGGIGWLSLVWTVFAMRRLRRALTTDTPVQRTMLPDSAKPRWISSSASTQPAGSFPLQSVQPYVTEGTTEILLSEGEEDVTAQRRGEGRESD